MLPQTGTSFAWWALALVAVSLVGGVALLRRSRRGALVAALAVVAVGVAGLSWSSAPAASADAGCASGPAGIATTQAPAPSAPVTSTTPPTAPPSASLRGRLEILWEAPSAECAATANDAGTWLVLLDDVAERIVWSGPVTWASGGVVVDDLPLPTTLRAAFSDVIVDAYPAGGVVPSEGGFSCTVAGVGYDYAPTQPTPATAQLTAAAPRATLRSTFAVDACIDESGESPTADADGDGVDDCTDLDADGDAIPDALEDLDRDGRPGNDDVDGDLLVIAELGDGIPGYLDLDSDDDGILDLAESGLGAALIAQLDTDDDGVIDAPSGANGLADALETFPESGVLRPDLAIARDADGDGKIDAVDLMSDGATYDLYAVGLESFDDLGAGFVSRRDDPDGDGVQAVVDGTPGARGSLGSPGSPLTGP